MSCPVMRWEYEAEKRRYRRVLLLDFPTSLVTVKFILGLPPYPENPISKEAVSRSALLRRVQKEAEEFNDIVILPVSLL